MKINDPTHHQPDLLSVSPDADFKTAASARAHYGNAMEEVVCKALGLTPIKISGSKEINFDAKKGEVFYEIKSVKDTPSSKSVIYKWRMEKEESSGATLVYLFGLHKVSKAKSFIELWDSYAEKGVRIAMVASYAVRAMARRQTLQKIKQTGTESGYTRKGYCDGYYNLPVGVAVNTLTPSPPFVIRLYDRDIQVTLLT